MAGNVEEYRGRDIVIRFDGRKCIHSRQCVVERSDVFEANAKGPWIHPDAATPEAIAAVALTCPSGAITWERLDGGQNEPPPAVNVVRVRENGPLAFHADVRIDGAPAGYRATLCRCGASKHKPYCDGSHTAAGFTATGEPASQVAETLAVRDGPLTVTPNTNGSLMVEGALEVCSGTGRMVHRVTKTWLCRCGGSANKPFCDGTHKRIGFKSG